MKGGPLHKRRRSERKGIALFMVMASLAVLTILMTELTYSTQINSRLSYNFIDNLKAFYLAKAALKLCEVRLKAYLGAKHLLDTQYKDAKSAMPPGILDKIWSMPLVFPIPVPKEALGSEADAIKDFFKNSSLPGSFVANIVGESSKLNLNMLFGPGSIPGPSSGSGTSGASGGSGTSGGSGASGASGGSGATINFRPALVDAITSVLEQKKTEDREFADVYRNVRAEDIVTAIEYYLFPDKPPSNLPGFKEFKPKLLPFYSLSELHFIPGIDDEIFNLLEGILTVYSTPGININTINKRMLLSLIPEMTDPEADDVLRNRDDPDVGQPWQTPDDFWKAVSATSAGRQLDAIKKRLSDAGISLIVEELSFKVNVLANVGLSTRRLEAWLIVDPNAANQTGPSGASGQQQGQKPGAPVNPAAPSGGNTTGGIPGTKDASGNAQPSGLNLIYWRML